MPVPVMPLSAMIPLDKNVYDAALLRIAEAFGAYDQVYLSFSGGKDSTTLLLLALRVARELGRTPIDVIMLDEEVIDPDTIAFCEDVRQHPDVRFHWYCVPVQHSLQSMFRSHWLTWDPDASDVWARSIPPWAKTDVPGWKNTFNVMQGFIHIIGQMPGTKADRAVLVGTRVEESLNRRRALFTSGTYRVPTTAYTMFKPIYDWTWRDVWRLLAESEVGYSPFYDKLRKVGVSPGRQRVAPWGNAAQKELRLWPEIYPDFWEKAIRRLPELRAAQRYAHTALYRASIAKPDGITWREYVLALVDALPDEDSKEHWRTVIEARLARWHKSSSVAFPDEPTFVGKGMKNMNSWKFLAFEIAKNDHMGRDAI